MLRARRPIPQQIAGSSEEYGPRRILVTENGSAYRDTVGDDGQVDDPERARYLEEHLAACARAVKRGADVRVVLPLKSDVPAVTYATRRLYSALLRRGVRLFEWAQSILHSKIAVIDDWCTVGTHNLDYRSWIYNLELNVVVDDPVVADAVLARIQEAVTSSVEVDSHAWRFRPLADRLLEEFFYRFRRIL